MEVKLVVDKMILMKVTSRGRPTQLIHCIKEYLRLANNSKRMCWLISCDMDDESCANKDFVDSLTFMTENNCHVVFDKSESKIHAINRDINDFDKDWDILLNISDDQIPIVQGYDKIIREVMPNSLDASLWFNDGAQDRINTQEIIGRKYYERTNYIYDPRFKSFYCDNLSTIIADKYQCLLKFSDCLVRHDHPACMQPTSISYDSLYERNQKFWDEDKAMFNSIISNGI